MAAESLRSASGGLRLAALFAGAVRREPFGRVASGCLGVRLHHGRCRSDAGEARGACGGYAPHGEARSHSTKSVANLIRASGRKPPHQRMQIDFL
jgi:hypothetical protein